MQVTAFEYNGDLVPLTDGMSNPATSNTVTVHADNPGTDGPMPHDALNYATTAARYQASGNPNAVRFTQSTQNFSSGENAVVRDCTVTR